MKADEKNKIGGPLLALDLGHKRIGVAISDELLISITRLKPLRRSSWKQLLRDVQALAGQIDAQGMVIGLPLRLEGGRGAAALAVQNAAEKFARSLEIPVFLQDERLTSIAAEERLREEGYKRSDIPNLIDSEAAAIILSDFITSKSPKARVARTDRKTASFFERGETPLR